MADSNCPILVKRSHCPGCNGTSFTMLHREPMDGPGISGYMQQHYGARVQRGFGGYDYELVECQACGLAFQAQVPSDELLGEIYDRWLPETERSNVMAQHDFNTYRYLSDQVEFMLQHLGMRPHDVKVLDFGFGWAEWSKMAAAYGCDVSGAELSQLRIEYAKKVGIRVLDSNALPQGEFHFINTEQVFEHLVDPGAVLKTLAGALRPGGLLKVSVPDAAHSLSKLQRVKQFTALTPGDIMAIAPFEHINSFTHASLVAMGKAAGLVPVRPSLRKLYSSSSGWMEPRYLLRLLMRPIYRFVYPKSAFVYFTRPH